MQNVKLLTEQEYQELHEKMDYLISVLTQGHVPEPDLPKLGEWLTEAETKDLLGVSTTTLWRLRKDGRITFSKVFNRIYYSYSDILERIEGNVCKPFRKP